MTLFKQAFLVSLALSIVMLAGKATAQAPGDVSGTWTGSASRGASTFTLVLKQEGKNVSGTLSGFSVQDDGPIDGTVEGNTIKLRSKSGSSPLLNVKGDQITGIMSAGSGTVTLKRQK